MNFIFNRVLRKGWKWLFLAILIGVVTYKTTFAPVPVSTQSITVGKIVAEVMGTGTLEAHYQATVSSKIQGLIVELLADQNDWVKTGQLLARLDDSDLIREVIPILFLNCNFQVFKVGHRAKSFWVVL